MSPIRSLDYEAYKAGLHGEFRVTPVTMSSGVVTDLPEDPLRNRKTVGVYVLGDPGDTLWVGGQSVSTERTTTSGIPVLAKSYFGLDAGRSQLYGITTTSGLLVKVIEVA